MMKNAFNPTTITRVIAFSSILWLSGCVVGPDFTSPDSTLPDTWDDMATNTPQAQELVSDQWWGEFNDPILNRLIEKVGRRNLDLKIAIERLKQSESLLSRVAADELPGVDGGVDYNRARSSKKGLSDISGNDGKKAFNVWNSAISSAWELDLWGRVQRAVEAAEAGVTVAEADRDAVYISLMADTAANYIRLRGVQKLLAVTQQSLETSQKTAALTKVRFDHGVATELEVSQAAALTSSIKARIPSLKQCGQETLTALSLLIAEQPGSLYALVATPGPIPSGAKTIAIGVPSELAKRRPDIRKAEAELHGATASIGVAKANFYPSITLSGSAGFQANQLSDLGSWGARQFSFGPALSIPIFEGGRLKAMLNLSESKQREAALRYQKVVLVAWHEVSDSMSSLTNEQDRNSDLRDSVSQSQKALQSVQFQYQQGATDFLNVLSVQNMLLANESALATSTASVSLSAVRLYKALGGGWNEDSYQPSASQPDLTMQ